MAEHVSARWARRTLADLRAGQLSREQIIALHQSNPPRGDTMTTTEYSACADCYMTAANGYSDGASDSTQRACDDGIRAILEASSGVGVTTGEDLDDFSWSPCEVCGSQLGGSRHAVLVLA